MWSLLLFQILIIACSYIATMVTSYIKDADRCLFTHNICVQVGTYMLHICICTTWIYIIYWVPYLKCDCLSKNQPCSHTNRNSFYCPSLITILYACSLPPLANVNWSGSPDCFSEHVNIRLVKWHPWRAPIWQRGPDIAPTVSTCLSRPYSGILALCGCMWTS